MLIQQQGCLLTCTAEARINWQMPRGEGTVLEACLPQNTCCLSMSVTRGGVPKHHLIKRHHLNTAIYFTYRPQQRCWTVEERKHEDHFSLIPLQLLSRPAEVWIAFWSFLKCGNEGKKQMLTHALNQMGTEWSQLLDRRETSEFYNGKINISFSPLNICGYLLKCIVTIPKNMEVYVIYAKRSPKC